MKLVGFFMLGPALAHMDLSHHRAPFDHKVDHLGHQPEHTGLWVLEAEKAFVDQNDRSPEQREIQESCALNNGMHIGKGQTWHSRQKLSRTQVVAPHHVCEQY